MVKLIDHIYAYSSLKFFEYEVNETTGNGNYMNLSKTYVKGFVKSLIFSGFKPFETTVRHVQASCEQTQQAQMTQN